MGPKAKIGKREMKWNTGSLIPGGTQELIERAQRQQGSRMAVGPSSITISPQGIPGEDSGGPSLHLRSSATERHKFRHPVIMSVSIIPWRFSKIMLLSCRISSGRKLSPKRQSAAAPWLDRQICNYLKLIRL